MNLYYIFSAQEFITSIRRHYHDTKTRVGSIFIGTMELGLRTLEFYFKNFVDQFIDESFSFVVIVKV